MASRFVVVQLLRHFWLFLTPIDCSMSGSSVLHYLLEFAHIHFNCISDAVYPSHPLPPSFPPAPNLFQHQVHFQWVGSSHKVAKVLELQFFQWIFRVDFLYDWLVWQQSKALSRVFYSTIWKDQFLGSQPSFTVLLSHPHMTTGEIIALTIWIFVSKVMSLLFNMLSRFLIVFLTRSKRLLISWLQSLSTVISEPKKMKYVLSPFPLLFVMKWWDQMPWFQFFECWVLSQLFHPHQKNPMTVWKGF